MNYILFDDATRNNLLPFTFVRPVADIRIGILTIREKWEKHLSEKTSTLTEDYLREKFPLVKEKENILINGSVCPTKQLVKEIKKLKARQSLVYGEYIIAIHVSEEELSGGTFIADTDEFDGSNEIETFTPHLKISNTWDIFVKNGEALQDDFLLLTQNRKSEEISKTNNVISQENIFIEEGAKIEYATLNASAGPIYIGKDAEIMEGSLIRGPFALCENAIVKMGAKIYGPTTVGPFSKVAGELSNVVIFGYSNKAHDGFLGNSVLGEWCNLGAGTNNSNLKNNYDEVKLWNYPSKTFVSTGLQFCGLILGDHSKTGINVMFNTGTVVGVYANIFGSGFQRNFIASYSWGGTSGFITYDLEKALEIAIKVFERRGMILTETERNILVNVYNRTYGYRKL
ncbi:MAG: GlmU family protein [Bacteroidota bacterium]